MIEPLDLLKQRLDEINAIDCDDEEFLRYRNKYISTIRFLEINHIGKYFKKKLNPIEEFYIKEKHKEIRTEFLLERFNISYPTFVRIINEK